MAIKYTGGFISGQPQEGQPKEKRPGFFSRVAD